MTKPAGPAANAALNELTISASNNKIETPLESVLHDHPLFSLSAAPVFVTLLMIIAYHRKRVTVQICLELAFRRSRGTKLQRSKPCRNRSAIPSASLTPVLRPYTCLICLAFSASTAKLSYEEVVNQLPEFAGANSSKNTHGSRSRQRSRWKTRMRTRWGQVVCC